jgi:hypothetical protein
MKQALKDSTTKFEEVNSDPEFYLPARSLRAINYNKGKNLHGNSESSVLNTGVDKIVFLPVEGNEFAENSYEEAYQYLYDCDFVGDDCSTISTDILKDFVDLKYAFIIKGYRITEPKIQPDDTFESGLFMAMITVFDITNSKAIYQFTSVASNSEEVSFREDGFLSQEPQHEIERDFDGNIGSEIWKSVQTHFNITK